MRVLMVMADLRIGGAEMTALELVRSLQGDGVDFTVAAMKSAEVMREAFLATGCKVYSGIEHFRCDPLAPLRLAKIIRRHDIEAMIVVDTPRNAMFYSALAALLSMRRLRTIAWVHAGPRQRRDNFVRALRVYRAVGFVDIAVCVSRAQRNELLSAGLGRRRTTIIRNGIDLRRFAKAQPAELGIPSDKRIIIQVANLMPHKDHATLLKAVSILSEQRDDFHLVLAGRDTDCDEMMQMVREADLTEMVTLAGRREDVPDLLAAADVFVLATRCETFGVAVIEAIAASLPIVISDLPPFEEIVTNEREGLKVPPAQPELLAEAIGRLLDDEQLRRRFAQAGCERTQCFAASRMAKRFKRLLERLTLQSQRMG